MAYPIILSSCGRDAIRPARVRYSLAGLRTRLRVVCLGLAFVALPTSALHAQTIYVPGGSVGAVVNGANSVGINTSTPAQKLDVYGAIAVSGQAALSTDASSIVVGDLLGGDGVRNLVLRAGDADRVTITSVGDVGVGISNPVDRISVYGSPAPSIGLFNATWGVGQTTALKFRHGDGTGDGAGNGGHAEIRSVLPGNGDVDLHFYTTEYLALNQTPVLALTGNSNVGIGTANPTQKLEIDGGSSDVFVRVSSTGGDKGVVVQRDNVGFEFLRIAGAAGGISGQNNLFLFDRVAPSSPYLRAIQFRRSSDAGSTFITDLTIQPSGDVGIGTTNPTHKLSVNGTIRAKEVIVEAAPWPDHVFLDRYRLTPLSEVEAHIKAEGHLPGIPSASEVAENGVTLGEMQAKLLTKVEELTLHLIAQEKKLSEATARITALEAENAGLRRDSN